PRRRERSTGRPAAADISVAASVKRLVQPRNQTGRGMPPTFAGAFVGRPFMGRPSVDRSSRIGALVLDRKARVRLHTVKDHMHRHLADGRSMLEAMARSTTDDPDVVMRGMAINEKVASGG